jgi:thiamine-monophosphate kinase
MMDLSDGLAADLPRLARASGAGARLDADRLPISDDARRVAVALGRDPTDLALYGGEDYELLFTLPPDRWAQIPPILAPHRLTATVVGRIARRRVLVSRGGKTTTLSPRGFEHFPRPSG